MRAVDEIIVIDNWREPTAEIRRAVRAFPGVRYEHEPTEGLNFARNRALTVSRSEIVAFLDDDVVLGEGWSAALLQAFGNGMNVGLCTGRVLALELETEGQRLFEANGGYDRGAQPIVLPDQASARLRGFRVPLIAWAVSIGNGSSLAVDRKKALALGGFDPALDLGRILPGGGDHDLLWRMLRAGYRVRYIPEALAYHEHRRATPEVISQIADQQRGFLAMLTKTCLHEKGVGRPTVWGFALWRLFKPGWRIALRLVGRDPLPVSALLTIWWNCWRGPLCYFECRNVAEQRRARSAGIEG